MGEAFENVLGRLAQVKRRGQTAMALCPAHTDRERSLSIRDGGDKCLINCHAGCDRETIVRALGLEWTDLFDAQDTPTQVKRETVYVYRDAEGAYLFEKVRVPTTKKDPVTGEVTPSKDFRQRIRKGDGTYEFDLSSLGAKSKTLFDYPDVRKAIREGRTVYLNEGEKACKAFAFRGFTATCQPAGADKDPKEIGGPRKWLPAHTEALRGAVVVIVADRDEVGEQYARYVAKMLKGIAQSVRVVRPASLNPHDDAYDHFQAGFGINDFIPAPDLNPKRSVEILHMNDIEAEDVSYLWPPYLIDSNINIVDAKGGVGKSTFILALAAGLSHGILPYGVASPKGKVKTLYFGGEDSPGELRTVYERDLGGDVDYIDMITDDFPLIDSNLKELDEILEEGGYGMFAFDALAYFLPPGVDMNDAQKVQPILKKIQRLARKHKITNVNVRHTKKGTVGVSADEYGMGSVQIRNSHRSQILLEEHPDQAKHRGVVVGRHLKGSILNPKGEPFAFRRGPFGWVSDFDAGGEEGQVQREDTKRDKTKAYLIEWLTGRYVPTTEVMSRFLIEGISERTVKEVRAELGVKSIRFSPSGPWHLHLPGDPADDVSEENLF